MQYGIKDTCQITMNRKDGTPVIIFEDIPIDKIKVDYDNKNIKINIDIDDDTKREIKEIIENETEIHTIYSFN